MTITETMSLRILTERLWLGDSVLHSEFQGPCSHLTDVLCLAFFDQPCYKAPGEIQVEPKIELWFTSHKRMPPGQ